EGGEAPGVGNRVHRGDQVFERRDGQGDAVEIVGLGVALEVVVAIRSRGAEGDVQGTEASDQGVQIRAGESGRVAPEGNLVGEPGWLRVGFHLGERLREALEVLRVARRADVRVAAPDR